MKISNGVLYDMKWIMLSGLSTFVSSPPQRDGSNKRPRDHIIANFGNFLFAISLSVITHVNKMVMKQ